MNYQSDVYDNQEQEIVDSLLHDFGFKLTETDDLINDFIARSYCHTWGVDDYQNIDARFITEDVIRFSVDMQWYGEAFDDDSPTIFNVIKATIKGSVIKTEDVWKILDDYELLNVRFGIDDEEAPAYISSVLANVNYFQTFSDEISSLRLLNELIVNDKNTLKTLQRQVFIGAITCLETYLMDALVNKVLSNEEFLKSFIANFNFGRRKLSINELYDFVEKADEIAKAAMVDLIYHDLRKIREIYRAVIGVTFPKMTKVIKAVRVRHDLVHRNGKTKEGSEVEISKQIVATVVTDVENFISQINQQLEKMFAPHQSEDDIPF